MQLPTHWLLLWVVYTLENAVDAAAVVLWSREKQLGKEIDFPTKIADSLINDGRCSVLLYDNFIGVDTFKNIDRCSESKR